MPSASAKVEKITPETNDSGKQFVLMLEKRMRNLEKRKQKLDNYRSDVQNGKELNEDQKIAVSKYDSVLSLVDFAKDLYKAAQALYQESSRQQKKQAKKEQLERQQHEIQRLQEAFIYCNILSYFQNEDVRNDFLNGENGAVKLTNDQLSQLDLLYKQMGPGLPNEQADIANHFHVLAENHIFLVEGKNKEVAGTTYKVLKELLQSIKESGYFSKPSEPIEDGVSSDEMPEEDNVSNKHEGSKENSHPPEEDEIPQDSPEKFETTEDKQDQSIPVQENIVPEPVPIVQNGPLQEVLSNQGSFNFLQESQIDLDAPHMDPAVVAVHQMAPPPAINFGVNTYPSPQPVDEIPPTMVNGTEPHEMSVSPPAVNQIPVMPSGIPRTIAPPVLTSVQHGSQHDFDPSHPIPTQTFTNQSFAVMQNMMLPPAYVPVTMHHGPLPPHMTPIAVVPGPAVTSAPAPVIPVPVATLPVSLQESNVPEAKSEVDEVQQANGETPSETDPTLADQPIEKGNEANSYQPHRGGYRGRGRGRGGGFFRGRPNYHNGRGGYQNHYYQERNSFNGNFRRSNNRGPRGNGNNRGRGNFNRTQTSQQQHQQQQPQQQQQQTQQ